MKLKEGVYYVESSDEIFLLVNVSSKFFVVETTTFTHIINEVLLRSVFPKYNWVRIGDF